MASSPPCARGCNAQRSVQGAVDLLGQLARDPFDAGEVVDAGAGDAAQAAEALQQPCARARADAGDVLEPAAAGADAGAARAHAGDREAVRLVADLRHQHQRRRVVAEPDLRTAIGEDQLLETDLAPLALLDTD